MGGKTRPFCPTRFGGAWKRFFNFWKILWVFGRKIKLIEKKFEKAPSFFKNPAPGGPVKNYNGFSPPPPQVKKAGGGKKFPWFSPGLTKKFVPPEKPLPKRKMALNDLAP